jgi:hypothetical protein
VWVSEPPHSRLVCVFAQSLYVCLGLDEVQVVEGSLPDCPRWFSLVVSIHLFFGSGLLDLERGSSVISCPKRFPTLYWLRRGTTVPAAATTRPSTPMMRSRLTIPQKSGRRYRIQPLTQRWRHQHRPRSPAAVPMAAIFWAMRRRHKSKS